MKVKTIHMSTFRTTIRWGSLLCIIIVYAYLLIPPKAETDKASGQEASANKESSADAAKQSGGIKYDIKFMPGWCYMPGTVPFGILPPLKGMTEVINSFEKLYPDTRITPIMVPVGRREYLVTQLAAESAPDIVGQNVENAWPDIHKNWYVPLTQYLEAPNPFVKKGDPGSKEWWDMFKYQAISRGKRAPDGKDYGISIDMVETGIFYNKDIFSKVGVNPPGDWEEFIAIMKKLKAAGYIPLAGNLDCLNDWCQDLVFDQYYNDILPGIDVKKDPQNEERMKGHLYSEEIAFLNTKGFFTGKDERYREVWKTLHDFRQYMQKNLLSADVNREFVTQHAAMLWTISGYAGELHVNPNINFKWGVFYLPSITKKTSKYANGAEMCVIGGSNVQYQVTNSAVKDTSQEMPFDERMKKSERLKRVIAFLQFLCLPRNIDKVVNEAPAYIPNIVGAQPLAVFKDFDSILLRKYATTKWFFTFDLKFNDIMVRMQKLYYEDGISLDEFLKWQEENVTSACQTYISRVKPDFGPLEKTWKELAPVRAGMQNLPCDENEK